MKLKELIAHVCINYLNNDVEPDSLLRFELLEDTSLVQDHQGWGFPKPVCPEVNGLLWWATGALYYATPSHKEGQVRELIERIAGLASFDVFRDAWNEAAHDLSFRLGGGTYKRDDCGGFIYPNGFRFPLEDTGSISDACRDFHGGQGCPLYMLQSSWHASPEIVTQAATELEGSVTAWENSLDDPCPMDDDADKLDREIASAWQAVEDLNRWADGVRDLLDD